MGCDIHSVAVDKDGHVIVGGIWSNGKTANPDHEWLDDEGEPFGNRYYGVFGFLAGVRNYSGVAPISEPRGLPKDLKGFTQDGDPVDNQSSDWLGDHSHSWLSISELTSFNYDSMMVDRRGTEHYFRQDGSNGGITLPENTGKAQSWREFLGDCYFADLAELQRIGADRVVFGFDS